jgi:hypothetical protein
LQGHSDLKKFKKGLPCYLDEMDMMFTGNTADGSSAFIAANSSPVDLTESCDDDERADDPEC